MTRMRSPYCRFFCSRLGSYSQHRQRLAGNWYRRHGAVAVQSNVLTIAQYVQATRCLCFLRRSSFCDSQISRGRSDWCYRCWSANARPCLPHATDRAVSNRRTSDRLSVNRSRDREFSRWRLGLLKGLAAMAVSFLVLLPGRIVKQIEADTIYLPPK